VGYLLALEESLLEESSPTINFGPNEPSLSVAECAKICFDTFLRSNITLNYNLNNLENSEVKFEAATLNLNITQARQILRWEPTWNQSKAIENTVLWWSDLINGKKAQTLTLENISNFLRESKLFSGKGNDV
jgi:nucleoside-diphosphate-sugar epimerase